MEYTEQVMEHFRNPRNMGRMENPDGAGKVGNPVCLRPDQQIHVEHDMNAISRVEEGMRALTHEGVLSNITQVHNRPYSGPMVFLKNRLGGIWLTPEHSVLAMKLPKTLKYLRTRNKKTLEPSWHHAHDLSKGDIALFPIAQETKDVEPYSCNTAKKKFDFKSVYIPSEIKLCPEFFRLAGYYLAEGHCKEAPCKTYLTWTFNNKEKDFAEDIRAIVKALFNLPVAMKEIPERKTLHVLVYNVHLTRLFKRLFGDSAENKRIPDMFMNAPLEKQKELLIGLWRGDGYHNLHRDGPRFGYSTISETLVQQIKTILLRLGVVPSVYKEKEKIVDGVKHKNSYRIHVGQRESVLKMCELFGVVYEPPSFASVDSWLADKFLFTPITAVGEESYRGYVHNLEVAGDHSFSSEGFCLHNCGDVMHIYIKVKDNRIDDIKFETFGCGAAIATSSVATELAKGKTIEEAEKITNEDVVKVLGGLPPVKKHCSLLAEEGLRAAIKDYREKKGKV